MTYDHQMRHVKRLRCPVGDCVAFEQTAVYGGARPSGRDVRPEGVSFSLTPSSLREIRKLRIHGCAYRGLDTVGAEEDIARRRAPVLEAELDLTVGIIGLVVGHETLAQVDAL